MPASLHPFLRPHGRPRAAQGPSPARREPATPAACRELRPRAAATRDSAKSRPHARPPQRPRSPTFRSPPPAPPAHAAPPPARLSPGPQAVPRAAARAAPPPPPLRSTALPTNRCLQSARGPRPLPRLRNPPMGSAVRGRGLPVAWQRRGRAEAAGRPGAVIRAQGAGPAGGGA